ncbi:MAG: hypothetical protein AABZ92_03910, partial [Verrucomicrobiota bacterium]
MTAPTFFSGNSAYLINSSSFDQRLSERTQRLISLFRNMTPISNETTDYQGNRSRLWALTSETFFGAVSQSNGNISIILSDKIINFCTNSPVSLESLRKLQKSQVDLA